MEYPWDNIQNGLEIYPKSQPPPSGTKDLTGLCFGEECKYLLTEQALRIAADDTKDPQGLPPTYRPRPPAVWSFEGAAIYQGSTE